METNLNENGILIIPSSVTEIEEDTLLYNEDIIREDIIRVIIPSSVTAIDNEAFFGWSNLKQVYYDGTVEQWVNIHFGCENILFKDGARFFVKTQESSKGDLFCEGDEILPGYEELVCANLRGVECINDCAFEECRSICSIDVTGVGQIGAKAFFGCANLSGELDLTNVGEIGERAFCGCNLSGELDLTNVGKIDEMAFYGCTNLSGKLNLTGVTEIGDHAFSRININEVTLPLSVTTLHGRPFCGCYSLKTISCQAKKRPKGWEKSWDCRTLGESKKFEVKWGCKID